jgi:hypothetical protein
MRVLTFPKKGLVPEEESLEAEAEMLDLLHQNIHALQKIHRENAKDLIERTLKRRRIERVRLSPSGEIQVRFAAK